MSYTEIFFPLTSYPLSCYISTLCTGLLSLDIDKVLVPTFLLAFSSFLHCSEFTLPSFNYDQPPPALVSDCSTHSSKTKKLSSLASVTVGFFCVLKSYLSPFEPIQNPYINQRLAHHASLKALLFITKSGSHLAFLVTPQSLVLHKSGFFTELYSRHSFCIGATSTASRQWTPDHS